MVEVGDRRRARAAQLLAEAGFTVEAGRAQDLLLVQGGRRGAADPAEIADLLVGKGQRVSHLARHRPSLERIYHRQIAQAA